ncbi:winged helix-turn-helix transcriptional regulator [Nonomuraea sp. B12E4]|uniref:winged helix-turn-helix transcriptional regulator n=1 Tax=Nonomuraea sp. B12E4 TaxID=3153564 RepID=UPI00325E319E
MRFFELRRRIDGISEKMLSAKLRILVRDGGGPLTLCPAVYRWHRRTTVDRPLYVSHTIKAGRS